jgi:cobalt-zinc-cadmium efflux system membrane fusion protein
MNMDSLKRYSTLFFVLFLFAASHGLAEEGKHEEHDESSHDEAGHEEESEEGVVELSHESIRVAGIQIKKLTLEVLPDFISAPGEVQLDQYSSAEVTPLIDAVVIKRHARLGDEVEVGQSLVTLASVDVAAAQGELRIAATEWRRVRKLGQAAVSAKRFTEAEVAFEQARLKLSAYGLDNKQIEAVANRKLKGSLGQFDLSAPVAGTVLRDEFRVGQRIVAGQSLFLIADESQVWVEANLSPHQAKNIRIGIPVQVNMGGHWHNGSVIQKHHLLDEQTRTVPLRIAVEPNNEHHHAGEFVWVAIAIETATAEPTLVVPESALMQVDEGKWTVFVEFKEGHFKQTGVRRGPARGGKVPIKGIEEGSSVVMEGAFFLAAELAKSGFDIHNH